MEISETDACKDLVDEPIGERQSTYSNHWMLELLWGLFVNMFPPNIINEKSKLVHFSPCSL